MVNNGSRKQLIDDIISEDQLDELFRDYYRHRDNSMLQLIFLVFSKAKVSMDTNVPDAKENCSDDNVELKENDTMFT